MKLRPQFIELNITELCNRTCSFCPRGHNYPNLNLNMSINTAIEIREQSKGFVNNVHLVGRGEPLLHPNFLEIVKVFSKDFSVRIMTNGDTLGENINDLNNVLNLNSGKHRVTVSLYDGEEQYNYFKKEYNFFQDISLYKTYDEGQGTDNIDFNKKHFIANRAGSLYAAKSNQPCYIPLNRMFIDWDGSVNLCCHDWTEKAIYGNIHTESLENIYKFIVNKYGRKLVKGDRSCTKQCSLCDVSSDDPLKFVYSNYLENQEKRVLVLNETKF
jgi:sulfatase maturation enzyme AslB (radical SAM superfamily)